MMVKLFDVIIPYYNKEDYIIRAIKSIDNKYVNKIIIVDDFSTKNINEIVNNFDNIDYIRLKQNMGPSYCRNLGASRSSSEYLLFLDADDFYINDCLKNLDYIIRENRSIAIFCWDIFKLNGNDLYKKLKPVDKHVDISIKDKMFYQTSLYDGKLVITASSFCVKSSFYTASGGFNIDLRVQEDPEYFCRISRDNRICYISSYLSCYDISVENSLSKKHLMNITLPKYVSDLLEYNDDLSKILFKKELKKYYLLALLSKNNFRKFIKNNQIYFKYLPFWFRWCGKVIRVLPNELLLYFYSVYRNFKYR